ncbi:MAG: single-stranded-DNA-specific exonuclease RecJ [Anaerolineales bacterium]|nr:single-stranded-DNA-specific exonuclease RecJ [Anaerolineales bacterium]MCB9127185.1 single-stranded-DNA-specific exonuclease RecJ [Ardenticatenales bacterium]MCB9171941.1 single-stranded-DNA-specific exonuclease RecJ [Ardenticatenales bacterium]
MTQRLWSLHPKAPESHFRTFAHLSRPVAQLLYNRGLTSSAAAHAFLARTVSGNNPFELHGMFEAVTRIRHALARNERIMVHGDFDADGVTSTTVLVTALSELGATVAPYIPHRVDEGYGLNDAAIRKMAQHGVSLMITVDCGIRAHNEIALANDLGIDVIVTDHHSVPDRLPPALAIVNPHQPECRYPHKELAGVGLAWKVVQALYLAERKRPIAGRQPLHPNELLDLVAIGTVADIAPLVGENRWLVSEGLAQLRQRQRPGVRALLDSAHVDAAEMDSEAIGFFIGPRINAAGRLDHAQVAYKLLRAPTLEEGRQIASHLEFQNRQRQELTRRALARAEAQIRDPDAPLLMVADNDCPEGIVGLVAGRLCERFYRPAIVVSEGPRESRASCRSIPELHITQLLDEVGDLLMRYGGHAAAAGFTVETRNLPELQEALTALAAAKLADYDQLLPKLVVDAELPLHQVSDELIDEITHLAPFGERNPAPVWVARNLRVVDARPVGSTQSHLKLWLQDGEGQRWSAIAFRQGERFATLPPVLDVVFQLKRNVWRGQSRIELQLSDFREAELAAMVG